MTAGVSGQNSGTIPVSRVAHQGPRDLPTLMVDKRGTEFMLHAQVTRGRGIILDDAGATALCDVLGAWWAGVHPG